jgi:uncharacterized protein (TIGR03437 family)
LVCGLFFVAVAPVAGQVPVIAAGGIVNNAGYAAGPVAPGSIASIFGTDLASSLAGASTVPLSTVLGDVSVTVNGLAAPLDFVSPGQINLQIPYEALPPDTSTATMNVVVNRTTTGASQPVSIQVAAVAPGIYTDDSGHAIAINSDGTLAIAPNSIQGLTTHSAAAGDLLVLYVTGLGAVTPSGIDGTNSLDTLRSTVVTPVVMIGGVRAQVLFSGLSPQFTGVNQINIIVPAGAPSGTVPLQIQAGSITTSNRVTVAIGPH